MATKAADLLWPQLGFALRPGGLSVAYCASSEPQILEIQLSTTKKTDLPPIYLLGYVRALEFGFGAGAEFYPTSCAIRHVSGHLDYEERGATGPKWRWEFEVSAFSPFNIRYIVDTIGILGDEADAKSLSFVGSKPAGKNSPMVTDDDVIGWLGDRTAYLGSWPKVPFPIKDVHTARGGGIKLTLGVRAERKHLDRLINMLSSWSLMIGRYPNAAGDKRGDISLGADGFAFSKSELRVRYSKFTFARDPARDLLINGLIWFHEKVAPIAEAELSL